MGNEIFSALVETDLDFRDPTMTFTALQNPQDLPLKEIAAVTAVGLGLSYFGRSASPLLLGTGLYLLGYYIRGERPADGWGPLR